MDVDIVGKISEDEVNNGLDNADFGNEEPDEEEEEFNESYPDYDHIARRDLKLIFKAGFTTMQDFYCNVRRGKTDLVFFDKKIMYVLSRMDNDPTKEITKIRIQNDFSVENSIEKYRKFPYYIKMNPYFSRSYTRITPKMFLRKETKYKFYESDKSSSNIVAMGDCGLFQFAIESQSGFEYSEEEEARLKEACQLSRFSDHTQAEITEPNTQVNLRPRKTDSSSGKKKKSTREKRSKKRDSGRRRSSDASVDSYQRRSSSGRRIKRRESELFGGFTNDNKTTPRFSNTSEARDTRRLSSSRKQTYSEVKGRVSSQMSSPDDSPRKDPDEESYTKEYIQHVFEDDQKHMEELEDTFKQNPIDVWDFFN